jgi:hypothetical protein
LNTPQPFEGPGLDIGLLRQIDAVCRRFETDWREARGPRVEHYLAEVPEESRHELRAELEALEQELWRSAQTVAPADPGTQPLAGHDRPTVHEDDTVAPGEQLTI